MEKNCQNIRRLSERLLTPDLNPNNHSTTLRCYTLLTGCSSQHFPANTSLSTTAGLSMEQRKKLIFVGAKPTELGDQHPGGQLTASLALCDYACNHAIELSIIDTTQSSFPVPPARVRYRKALRRLIQLMRYIRKGSVTGAIIFSSSGPSFYERTLMALLCRIYRIPCLLFMRSGHFIDDFESSRWRRFLWAKMLRIPTALGAQGRQWVNFFQDRGIGSERILLIRNWLSPRIEIAECPNFHSTEINSGIVFVFAGHLVAKKGVVELIEAVNTSNILRQHTVLLAGDGDLKELLEKKISQYRLDRVRLLGWQRQEELIALYQRSHVFVLPTYAEGFPNALLEAFSQGMAAVVTPVGGIPDTAIDGENALWAKPRDVLSLRLAMETYAQNPRLVDEHAQQSLAIVRRNHNAQDNCKKLFDYFKRPEIFGHSSSDLSDDKIPR